MTSSVSLNDLIKQAACVFEIPKKFRADMRVPARFFLTDHMLQAVIEDRSLNQLVNVATLPGIVKWALAMPDIHQGYGFPIGGVAALAVHQGGVVSPGGIGYDINCGVRLLALSASFQEIKPHLERLAAELFHAVPSGVGRGGKLTLNAHELDAVLKGGAHRMLELGFGIESDIQHCEEYGFMSNADAAAVSDKAKKRGANQLGTLGSGNHFLEVQYVDKIYDQKTAQAFGLHEQMVTVMVHCGSRGLGHQTCTDYVRLMLPKLDHWGIELPDKELACAPINSPEGIQYFNAMAAAANFAWANRHLIGHWVRESVKKTIGLSLEVRTVYDLSHNIGKKETHLIDDKEIELLVHRKGATRAFGPHAQGVAEPYRAIGHPVLIPGTMGTASYVLVGTERSMAESFGSCCHGAGRRMSRMQAQRNVRGSTLREQLEAQQIIVRCESDSGLAQEAPIAYKDVDEVVSIVEQAGLAKKVARLVPTAVIKGG